MIPLRRRTPQKAKIYYIYVDVTLDNQRPFYVGKGQYDRVRRKARWKAWTSFANKHGWDASCRHVILATTDEAFAFAEERRLIAHHKTFKGGGPDHWGANMTEGGEGSSGYRWSEASRRKVSGANHRMYGKSMPDAERAKRAGENHQDARLTWELVEEIRERYARGGISTRQLGELYGITGQHVAKIVKLKKWLPQLKPLSPALA